MKIICPNCRQAYRIDPAKMSAGVSEAACKSCGTSIPLKKILSNDTPTKTQVLELTCTYCGQVQGISAKQISADVKKIQCKSCGHFFGVPPASSRNRSEHAEEPPPIDKKADKPSPELSKPKTITQIICPHCKRTYKIRSRKIPENAKSVRCKSCGQKIAIEQKREEVAIPTRGPRPEEPKRFGPHQRHPGQPLFRFDLMPEIKPGKIYRPRKKIWAITAAVGALAAIVILLWLV